MRLKREHTKDKTIIALERALTYCNNHRENHNYEDKSQSFYDVDFHHL